MQIGDKLIIVTPGNNWVSGMVRGPIKIVTVTKIGPRWTHLDGKFQVQTDALLGKKSQNGWSAWAHGKTFAGDVYPSEKAYQDRIAADKVWKTIHFPPSPPRSITMEQIEAIKNIMAASGPD